MRLFSFFFIVCSFYAYAQPDQELVDAFVSRYARLHQTPESAVRVLLGQAVYQPVIIEKMNKPAEKMSWHRYRNIFMKEERFQAGHAFIRNHKSTLEKVSADTGVPVEILAAIIGVESYFGRNKGSYQVLDALYTLAFAYPKRSKFFTSELEEFLVLVKEENLAIDQMKGSYAGAIGYCQFMPSSYRAYAKSFDQGGSRDLVNSVEDAIASVGNYLKEHRWEQGGPIAIPISKLPGAKETKTNVLKPAITVAAYEELGFVPDSPIDVDRKATLIELEQEVGAEYWLGFHNFYVITRYNHSVLYAMAVYQLAEELKKSL